MSWGYVLLGAAAGLVGGAVGAVLAIRRSIRKEFERTW